MPAAVLAAEDGPFSVPHAYELGPAESFIPYAIAATWSGAGAASPFLPCCSFYSQDGRLLARTFPAQVAAGDTAEVTYSPFGQPASAPAPAAGAGGIAFTPANVQQAGAWLMLLTHQNLWLSNDGPFGIGLENVAGDGGIGLYNDAGNGGIILNNAAGTGGIELVEDAPNGLVNIHARGAGADVRIQSNPGDVNGTVTLISDGGIALNGPASILSASLHTVTPAADRLTVGAAGAAAPLPAAPAHYIELWLVIGGAPAARYVIPVYNP